MGCCIGDESNTQGAEELQQLIIEKKLSICTVTWNVAGQPPNDKLSIDSLLKHKHVHPDIYVIGLQEIIDLNPVSAIKSVLIDKNVHILWENKIQKTLNEKLNKKRKKRNKIKYVHLKSINLMGILLIIFVKNTIKPNITNVCAEKFSVGFIGIDGSKGGVGIRFNIQNTSICFICCHLAAHKHQVNERNDNYNKIIQQLVFENHQPDPQNLSSDELKEGDTVSVLEHDVVFMFGDLNYRLDFNSNELQDVYNLIKQKNYSKLLVNDQLLNAIKNSNAFGGFNEKQINFKPTYKYEIKTNKYEQIKKRMPSYCDRILWKIKDSQNSIDCLKYDSYDKYNISDHKPVVGLYRLELADIDKQTV